MSLKHKLLDMYEEKSYTTELERVACEMYNAVCNVVEILVEDVIDKDDIIIRENRYSD